MGLQKLKDFSSCTFFTFYLTLKRLKKKVRGEVRRGLGAILPGLHGISLGLYILLTMMVFMHGVHIWGLNLHHARSIKNKPISAFSGLVLYGRHKNLVSSLLKIHR
jgi:hypothetical protein